MLARGLLLTMLVSVSALAQGAAPAPLRGPPPREPLPLGHALPTPEEAERIARSDAQKGQTGDQERHYWFAEAGAAMPYRIYVPAKWHSQSTKPMIVMLHGGGQDHNGVFNRAGEAIRKLADSRGYLILSPKGLTATGGFGARYHAPPAPSGATIGEYFGTPQESRLSEEEALAAIDTVVAEYKVDPANVFLMGNSLGGIGTWYLAQRYPERWAAISPSDGPPVPDEYPVARVKGLHVLAIHGEKDDLVDIAATRELAKRATAAGANVTFLPVPNGEHSTAWTMVLPQVFDFFDANRRGKLN
jgi:poly(3-hydroxybutyrate) depolymerase